MSQKTKSYILLLIPFVALFIFTMVLVSKGALDNLYNIAVGFLVVFIFEVYIFNHSIISSRSEAEVIKKHLLEQERSAQLLVRRDLELTKANEKLRELDKRKSEFLSVAAHQLRTPLSGIKWTFNMLLSSELGPITNDQKVFIMKGYESNERMIALVDDMLGADRIDSGKYHFNFVNVQILDLIDNVLYEILPSANKKNITIEFKDRSKVPQVYADPEKIRAVVQNLLDNAIKYTPKGGKITIETVIMDEYLKVGISDNGIGIPSDQRKNIFDRFFRGRNAVRVETDGSGLGLFIVKSIIEKHGGMIWFESRENQGTTFYFTVKIAKKNG